MTYVSDQNQIPKDTADQIRARLTQRLNEKLSEMNEYELRILDRSEKDFRDFVADIFSSIAAAFGYIVGVVVGTVAEIVGGVKSGWKAGYQAGRRKNS